MGRRDRERVDRIKSGLEQPIARKAVAIASRKGVVAELSKGSVSDQVGRLNELVGTGTLSERKLREAIIGNAPKEMDKAIRNFRKNGTEITVDSLLREIRSEPGFLKMCNSLGITEEWFEGMAKERMEANKV